MAALYNAGDPAVLRLIDMAIEAADGAEIPVNMCGQMSGNRSTRCCCWEWAAAVQRPPGAIPEIKNVCRSVTIAQCQQSPRRAMAMENARDIKSYLREELKKVLPDCRVSECSDSPRGHPGLTDQLSRRRADDSNAMVRQRMRIRFTKQGDLRWLSHRDLMRTWERLFRRAGVPLGMTEGFHPKPRMNFPSALAVGIAG